MYLNVIKGLNAKITNNVWNKRLKCPSIKKQWFLITIYNLGIHDFKRIFSCKGNTLLVLYFIPPFIPALQPPPTISWTAKVFKSIFNNKNAPQISYENLTKTAHSGMHQHHSRYMRKHIISIYALCWA